jgi:hypothetical protein
MTARFWEDVAPNPNNRSWIGRLIPVPTQWAPLFLGFPDLGAAFKRALKLVAGVDKTEQEKFRGFTLSMMFAFCLDANHKKAASALSTHWKRLPCTETNSAWVANAWQEGANPTVPIMAPPIPLANATPTDKFARFVGTRKRAEVARLWPRTPPQQVIRPPWVHGQGQTCIEPTQRVGLEDGPTTSGVSMGDIGTIIKTMIDAQLVAQVALMTTNNTNLIAFQTEMAKAMMVKAMGKDSKLMAIKKRILMACAGHADLPTFVVPAVYRDMDVEGGTTDALGHILRHRLKPIPLSPHKTNIHVTPQMVATVKALSFLSNGDKTYAGCTKGMTPFFTPWRLAEAMNEDIAKDQYFADSTVKLVEDIRKHITGAKLELPT